MMDIVDRIRKKADDDEARLGFWNPVITQAADEIVDLRAQLERVTAERDAALKEIRRFQFLRENEAAEVRYWQERLRRKGIAMEVLDRKLNEAKAERDQARKEVAAMETEAKKILDSLNPGTTLAGPMRANGRAHAAASILRELKKARDKHGPDHR